MYVTAVILVLCGCLFFLCDKLAHSKLHTESLQDLIDQLYKIRGRDFLMKFIPCFVMVFCMLLTCAAADFDVNEDITYPDDSVIVESRPVLLEVNNAENDEVESEMVVSPSPLPEDVTDEAADTEEAAASSPTPSPVVSSASVISDDAYKTEVLTALGNFQGYMIFFIVVLLAYFAYKFFRIFF